MTLTHIQKRGVRVLSFSELGLNPEFAAQIEAAGYQNPTELQQQLIPRITDNKSVIIWTQSASGKTGAFLIPAINYVLEKPLEEHRHTRILILTSRRDRVNQINYTIKRLMGNEEPQIRSGFIVSGRPYQPQMRLLRRPLDLMIATPGRLNDLVDNNKADFSKLEMLIIDDLSAIYHKGLHGLINKILAERETSCPVVTFVRPEDEVAAYARAIFAGAEELEVEDDRNPLLQIPQVVHLADDYTHKIALIDHLLDEFANDSSYIFTDTIKSAKTLADNLANHGHTAEIVTDKSNLKTLQANNNILIYTDQSKISPTYQGNEHVIHFELPVKVEEYEARLHGLPSDDREEAAILLVLPRERENLKKIEEFLGDSIEQCTLPGLAPLEHTSSFTPAVRSPRNNKQAQNKKHHGHSNKGQARGGRQQQGSGRNNNQNHRNKDRQHHAKSAGGPAGAGAGSSSDQRQRKGPYGRLNGGAQRKRNDNRQQQGGGGNMRRDNNGNTGGSYEIGSWEKPDYMPQNNKPQGEKKVVIRYKEKKRRLLTR